MNHYGRVLSGLTRNFSSPPGLTGPKTGGVAARDRCGFAQATYPASVTVLRCFERVPAETSRVSRSTAKSICSTCRSTPQIRSRTRGVDQVIEQRLGNAAITRAARGLILKADSGFAADQVSYHQSCGQAQPSVRWRHIVITRVGHCSPSHPPGSHASERGQQHRRGQHPIGQGRNGSVVSSPMLDEATKMPALRHSATLPGA
jgi:hypothetical protein